jgi:hypothetical protein
VPVLFLAQILQAVMGGEGAALVVMRLEETVVSTTLL